MQQLENVKIGIDQANVGIDRNFDGIQEIKLTQEQMRAELVVVANSQCELGLSIRQNAADANDNHAELKTSLASLSSNLTSGAFSKLTNVADSSSSLSTEQMIDMIQDAVKGAIPIVASSTGLNEELKYFDL